MNKKSPLLDTATAFLEAVLVNSTSERLPSIARMAKKARVSVYTMAIAAQKLARAGKLTILEGRGIWRSGCEPKSAKDTETSDTTPDSFASGIKSNRVATQFERDIVTGTYEHSVALPSLKSLCSRYDFSPRGMKRILETFISRGILTQHKKSYRIRESLHSPGKSALVMMVDAPESALATARIRFNSRLLDELEKQCHRQQLEFVLCAVTPEDEGMCGRLEKKISTIESEYAVLGYIVTGYYLKNPQETVRSICLQKKPVAVVYEGLIRTDDIANFPHNAHAFFFDSGKPSGALVARHLLMLGHRSIAYIDYESADGSRPDRREEIVRVMTAAGGTVQVSSVTQIHNDKINACFSDAARTISKRLEGDHLRSPIDKTLARRIYEKLTRNAEGETFRVNLHAALDQLFIEKMFTSIVGGGVTSPVFILEYLNLKKIDVPREISLAGFGNSLAEAENDITSYDCDCFSVAHAIIWHLLRSTERKGTLTNRITTIDGVLMTRLSTGKVRQ